MNRLHHGLNHWIRRFLAAGIFALLLAPALSVRAQNYAITLTDLTTGQPFSPPVFATHDASLSMWQAGSVASVGIQRIAEAGDRTSLVNALTPFVGGAINSLATPLSSPLLPGDSVSVMVSADAAHPLLSSVWMLGRTNDTFAGQSGINLLSIVGTQTFDIYALDAGTEVNTELATDLIAFGGNGHVAENGVIHAGEGIRGIDHFVNGLGVDINGIRTDIPGAWRYDPNSPIARITITSVPEPGAIALIATMGLSGAGFLVRRKRICK